MHLGISEKLKFLDEKPRHKALFLLLFRADDYLTSEELADQLKVTSRTIKTDIKQLKEEIDSPEMAIVSKRSLGYKMEILEKEYENKIKEFYQIFPSTTIESEFDHRVNYIVRCFLASKKPIKVEEIQKKLIINYSINRELQEVKQMLSQYDLSLVSRPHYGMMIKGATFKKVLLTIRMYRYFDKNASNDFGIPEYSAFFYCDNCEKEKIRQTFFKSITKSRIVFSDINAERFIVYLLYFRNQTLYKNTITLGLPEILFEYKETDEYYLVIEILQKLRNKFEGFEFTEEIIQFLTYIAIFSTDLYRFVDCSKENLAEETRNFLLREVSEYLQIDAFDDYTCLKDLLKIMIPISLKIMLNVSDSIDLRYNDFKNDGHQPILRYYMKKIYKKFFKTYHYHFSKREQHLIFLTFYGMLNRIVLEHRKLNVAIIAIDGRLSTQQLKFNLQHHFSEFIDRIETKVLYELDLQSNHAYDLYLCSNYGKKLNIQHNPIYYVEEEMDELQYIDSLKYLFFQAFEYEKKLPPFSFEIQALEEPIKQVASYDYLPLNGNIHLYLNLDSEKENFKILRLEKSNQIEYCLYVDLAIKEDKQKLKMLFNIIQRIVDDSTKLEELSRTETRYSYFLM
jgi:lichenan operon transcriptional antiterminator